MQVGVHDDESQVCMMPSCTQIDLLPYKCENCRKVFCTEHILGLKHNCSGIVDRSVARCPLCSQIVPLEFPTQSVDDAVSRHIDRGCRGVRLPDHTSTGRRANRPAPPKRCSLAGCTCTNPMTVTCGDCGHEFCVEHRDPGRHKCAVAEQRRASQIRRADLAEQKHLKQTGQKEMPTTSMGCCRSNGGHLADFELEPCNSRDKAFGKRSEVASDMYTLLICFPREFDAKAFFMYFSVRFTVGRSMDLAVAQASLSSSAVAAQSESSPRGSPQPRWYAFNLSALERAARDRELSSAARTVACEPLPLGARLADAGIGDGDIVLLSPEPALPESLTAPESLKSVRSMTEQKPSFTSCCNKGVM